MPGRGTACVENNLLALWSDYSRGGNNEFSMHLRQNFLYSEEVNKNLAQLFVLPYLNVIFDIPVSLSAKEKINWAKKTKAWWRHCCYDVVLS